MSEKKLNGDGSFTTHEGKGSRAKESEGKGKKIGEHQAKPLEGQKNDIGKGK